MQSHRLRAAGFARVLLAVAPASAIAQTDNATGGSVQTSPEEIEQMVAPIALYPDSLLAQIFMASTYPIEIVQAERWQKQNTKLTGDALATALEKQPWDASVKSLVNFPQVLTMMSEQLEWTTKLGDTFLEQQKQVMDAVQKLRAKAKAEGNLESTEEQKVTVQEIPVDSSTTTTTTTTVSKETVIVIEPSSPDVVYVPTYNPTVVYGAWPYPSYPPYSYYPPGYVATAAVSFGLGVACGAAWGYAWGGCNWGHGDVDIDVDRNSFRNTNIDRSRNTNISGNRGSWKHDPGHRQGAAYRDSATARKYNGVSSTDAARGRDSFRGRAEAGQRDIAQGGADQFRGDRAGGARPAQGDRAGAGQRPSTSDRGGAGAGARPSTADRSGAANRTGSGGQSRPSAGTQNRPSGGSAAASNRGGAFEGGQNRSQAKASSQRGQSSRASSSSGSGSRSSSASRSSGGGGGSRGGGGARGGGGGSRGGGGGRGGRGPGYDNSVY